MGGLQDTLVLIRGAGDLASGVALRLAHCGFRIVMTEIECPLAVRRTVSFCEAVYEGRATVEDLTARRVPGPTEALEVLKDGDIPVLVDPGATAARSLLPQVLVDAVMAKGNTRTSIGDAPLVIGLGPGFCAGKDVHAVIETNRGHFLGRVITSGSAEPDTGCPGLINGWAAERILRAPVAGVLRAAHEIGETIRTGETVAFVEHIPVIAQIDGVLRGMARDGLVVEQGIKIGDIDPRGEREHCFTVSDKALAIGGGVLEAILRLRGQIN